MGLVGLMSRATGTLASWAVGLSGAGSSLLHLHGASVAAAPDENSYHSDKNACGSFASVAVAADENAYRFVV